MFFQVYPQKISGFVELNINIQVLSHLSRPNELTASSALIIKADEGGLQVTLIDEEKLVGRQQARDWRRAYDKSQHRGVAVLFQSV